MHPRLNRLLVLQIALHPFFTNDRPILAITCLRSVISVYLYSDDVCSVDDVATASIRFLFFFLRRHQRRQLVVDLRAGEIKRTNVIRVSVCFIRTFGIRSALFRRHARLEILNARSFRCSDSRQRFRGKCLLLFSLFY